MFTRYTLLIVILVSLSLFTAPIFTQDDFTDNKCYTEWDCGDGTTDVSRYWWEAGWCAAAIEAEFISGTVAECTGSPDDDPVIIIEEDDEEDDKKKSKKNLKGCVDFGPLYYIDFGNSSSLPPMVTYDLYDDKRCTNATSIGVYPVWLVAARNNGNAQALCDDVDPGTTSVSFGGDVYYCNP